jgi:hypothetical protein
MTLSPLNRRFLAVGISLLTFAGAAFAQRAPLNSDPGNAAGVVNVNAAPRESLLLLYRTGKKLADQLLAERARAPFADGKDLAARVKGCSPVWFSVNSPHLAYSGETTLKHRVRRPVTNALPSFPSAPGLPNNR